MIPLSRRTMMALALAGTTPGFAQGVQRGARIGYLTGGDPASRTALIGELLRGLRELGYREGESFELEIVGAKGRFDDLPALARRMVDTQPDVILASTTPGALAAKAATTTVPIVFVAVGDPVGVGLVSNLARPEGNVTGLSNATVELPGKRLQFLKDLLPSLKRAAVLVNPEDENAELQIARTREAAAQLGIDVDPVAPVRGAADLEPAFRRILDAGAQAAVRLIDPLSGILRADTMRLAAQYRIPVAYAFREDVLAGGLIAYGPDQGALYHRAAYFIHRILRGARPDELAVERPSRFELLINQRTARALGLVIPESILARADEVIE